MDEKSRSNSQNDEGLIPYVPRHLRANDGVLLLQEIVFFLQVRYPLYTKSRLAHRVTSEQTTSIRSNRCALPVYQVQGMLLGKHRRYVLVADFGMPRSGMCNQRSPEAMKVEMLV